MLIEIKRAKQIVRAGRRGRGEKKRLLLTSVQAFFLPRAPHFCPAAFSSATVSIRIVILVSSNNNLKKRIPKTLAETGVTQWGGWKELWGHRKLRGDPVSPGVRE